MWNLLHGLVEQSASGSQDMASEGGLQWGIASQAFHLSGRKKQMRNSLTRSFFLDNLNLE